MVRFLLGVSYYQRNTLAELPACFTSHCWREGDRGLGADQLFSRQQKALVKKLELEFDTLSTDRLS